MTQPVKRLHYFHGQFLKEPDFTVEQQYHVQHQRDHARLLHTPGIAEGLHIPTPASGATAVTVNAGVAFDGQGRRLVLPDNLPLNLATQPDDRTVYVTIAYDEAPTDDTKETGISGDTRWTEQPRIELSLTAPENPNEKLVLAAVQRAGKTIKAIDLTPRRVAGAKNLTLTSDSITQSGWVTMNLGAAGRADLLGDLRVTGNLTVQGETTVASTERMQGNVILGDADNDITTVEGTLVSGHSSGQLKIGSPVDIAGSLFLADTAGQQATRLHSYSAVPSLWMLQPTTQRLMLADAVDWDRGVAIEYTPGTIGAAAGAMRIGQTRKNSTNFTHSYTALYTNGAERMRIDAAGNVGIGTATPTVNGGGLEISRTSQAAVRVSATAAGGKSAEFGADATGGFIQTVTEGATFRIYTGNPPKPYVVVDSTGNVGIGTMTPGATLDVNGAIKVGAFSHSAITGNARIGRADDATQGELVVQLGAANTSFRVVDKDWSKTIFDVSNEAPRASLMVASTGIGIGTTKPAETLDVNGRTKSGQLTVGPWPAGGPYVFFGANTLDQAKAGNYALLQAHATDSPGRTFLNSPVDIRFRINNADKMILDNAGNVGIGVTNPEEQLHVIERVRAGALKVGTWPADPAYVFFGALPLDQAQPGNYALLQAYATDSPGKTFLNSPVDIRFRIKNADKMILDSAGNVGIGTATPTSVLHVRKDAFTQLGPVLTLMNGGGGNGAAVAIDLASYDPKGEAPTSRIQAIDNGRWSADLTFSTKNSGANANKLVERVRIDSSGHVGIGTASPLAFLHVDTGGTANSGLILTKAASKPAFGILPWESQIYLSAGITFQNSAWVHQSDTNDNLILTLDPGTGVRWHASNTGSGSWNVANNVSQWDTSGYWKNLVQSDATGNSYFTGGNVGIGTASPVKPLDVGGSGGIRISQTGAANSTNEIFFQDNGQIRSFDDNHRIIFDRANNILELREYGDLVFSPGATSSSRTQTVTFKSGGNVGIGTANPTQRLEVNGNLRVNGEAYKTGAAVWLSTSDEVLKKDIAPIDAALEKLLQLRGVSFAWREPEQHNATDGRYMGMVAQDVEKVFPEWVRTVPSGHKGLALIGFEALVIEAVRQLSARCERLETEVAQLRGSAAKPKAAAPARKKS